MTIRRRLPDRREHELIEFDHGGFHYVAGIGRFADGSLAEIFLNVAKSGTPLETLARDAAILASIGMQHGATPNELRHALTRNRDGSAGSALAVALDMIATEDGAS